MLLRAAFSTSKPTLASPGHRFHKMWRCSFRVFIQKSIKDGHSRAVTSRGISEKRDSGARAYTLTGMPRYLCFFEKSEIRPPGLTGSLVATLLL